MRSKITLFFLSVLLLSLMKLQAQDTSLLNTAPTRVNFGNYDFAGLFNSRSLQIKELGNRIDSAILYRDLEGLVLLSQELNTLESLHQKAFDTANSEMLFRLCCGIIMNTPEENLDSSQVMLAMETSGRFENVNVQRDLRILLARVKTMNRQENGRDRGNEFEVSVANNSDEILYLYVDGVFVDKVYAGKTARVTCGGGCRKLEAENLDGARVSRQVCFTAEKQMNWTIKK